MGLACGLGARYPRFNADATQAAGSYGGVMFMIAAVALIIVTVVLVGWPSSMYLMSQNGQFGFRLTSERRAMIVLSFTAAGATCFATWWLSMKSGVRALDEMRK